MQSKNPASVIVFAAVASDGKVMPPHFIEAGLKINIAGYLKILKDVLMPWIRRNYDPFKVMLVQDSAPAHGAKKVQDFLNENLPLMVSKDIWLSSLPDLNVCDYWLFGVIEGYSNVNSHPSVNSLKASIRQAFRNLDPEVVKRSCSRFRSRSSQIIDAKGSHIEWFFSVGSNQQINTSKNYVLSLFAFQISEFLNSSVSPHLAARPCTVMYEYLTTWGRWFICWLYFQLTAPDGAHKNVRKSLAM